MYLRRNHNYNASNVVEHIIQINGIHKILES